jgi:ribosomal protein S18 acetylase RimI-like enzyme
LVRHVIEAAAVAGHGEVQLHVDPANSPARRLYERLASPRRPAATWSALADSYPLIESP